MDGCICTKENKDGRLLMLGLLYTGFVRLVIYNLFLNGTCGHVGNQDIDIGGYFKLTLYNGIAVGNFYKWGRSNGYYCQ